MFLALPSSGVTAHVPFKLPAAGMLSVPLILRAIILHRFLFQRTYLNNLYWFRLPGSEHQCRIYQFLKQFIPELFVIETNLSSVFLSVSDSGQAADVPLVEIEY